MTRPGRAGGGLVLVPALALALALLALALLLRLEFGPWKNEPFAVDELHFAVCAARANAVGEFPAAGCHDNKAPLVYAVHQAVQAVHGPYPVRAIKLWALGLVALVLLGVVALAARGATTPWAAAGAGMVGAALALQPMTADAPLLGLKTETLGMAFVFPGLVASAASARAQGWRRSGLAGLAGLAFGLAIATKQTHALVPVFVACSLMACLGSTSRALDFARAALPAATLGCVLPLGALAALFALQGRLPEFLGNLLIYPAVYGGPAEGDAMQRAAWKGAALASDLARTPAPALLALAGAVMAWSQRPRLWTEEEAAAWGAVAALLLGIALSPIYFAYHLLPVWLLLAALGGLAWARLARSPASPSASSAALPATLLLVLAALHASQVWWTEGGRRAGRPDAGATPAMTADALAGSRTGWVLGMWPEFYVQRGLLPASGILYPWALPGTPDNPLFRRPDPTSPWAPWLASAQARNLAQLYRDFEHTPPDVVALVEPLARHPGSARQADVPGLDRWLMQRCVEAPPLRDGNGRPTRLFDCRAAAARPRTVSAPGGAEPVE